MEIASVQSLSFVADFSNKSKGEKFDLAQDQVSEYPAKDGVKYGADCL